MPGDPFKKVQAGSKLRIPAATFNAFIDTTRQVQAAMQNRTQNALPESHSSGFVLVKNASGADQPRFAVLGVDAPVIFPADNLDEFKNKLALRAVTPTADHRGRFVVLMEPLKAGAIGTACAAGVCCVKVSAAHDGLRFADITDGDANHLTASVTGAALILWKESGTGAVWSIVRLGIPPPLGATFRVALTQDGGDAGGSGSDCSWTYTLHPYDDPSVTLATTQAPLRYRLNKIEYENAGTETGANVGLAMADGDEIVLLDVLTERPLQDADCEEET